MFFARHSFYVLYIVFYILIFFNGPKNLGSEQISSEQNQRETSSDFPRRTLESINRVVKRG